MAILPEMLVCGDITVTTSCTKLTCCHAVDHADWYFVPPLLLAAQSGADLEIRKG